MKFTVYGYHEGVSYALVADSKAKDELRGIVTQAPDAVISAVVGKVGQSFPVVVPGDPVKVSLKTPLGLLAGLAEVTEITKVDGDTPPGWPRAATGPVPPGPQLIY